MSPPSVILRGSELQAVLAAIAQALAGDLDGCPTEEEESAIVADLVEVQARICVELDR